MGNLFGKTALITGSGDGMGRAHAVLMASRGADIVVNDIKQDMAEETARMVKAVGRKVQVLVADMGDAGAVKKMAADAQAAMGRIDILVNNAGYGQRSLLHEISEQDYERMMAVHVKGSFFLSQALIPAMKERRWGKIINIASIWGMTGAPVASHYCAAKGALLGFTKAWAKELAPWNIHVNAVAPGGVRSGGPTKLDNPEVLRAKEERVPLKRYCEPVEISYAVAYLASPESDFVTGQVISPNGGETIVGF
jgi:3-oxoacyl-[acyl-carrier protein] reductase